MSKKRPRKTKEELIESGLRMYRSGAQWKDKLASGEITEEDLFIMADKWADKQIAAREKRLAGESDEKYEARVDDAEFRAEQEAKYRKNFVWESANDEASLSNLLDLEVQTRRVNEELQASKDDGSKNELRKTLATLVKEHRTLQKELGIDRVTRQKAEESKSAVDEWDRIKRDAKKKLDALAGEFEDKASKVTTEAELRDRLKYHGAIPFRMVDSILVHHRRVLGLDLDIDKS